jgi:hypothetical protein
MGHASEFSRRTKWAKVGHQKVNSLEKRASRRTTWPLSGLEHPFRLNFSRTGLFSLKTTIYVTPGGFRRGYGRVDQNHRNRESAGRCQRRSEGEKRCRNRVLWTPPPPVKVSTPSSSYSSASTTTLHNPPLLSLGKHYVWCNILFSHDLLYLYVDVWVVNCSWQLLYSLLLVAYKYLLSSMMIFCIDIWVHTLHVDLTRDSGSDINLVSILRCMLKGVQLWGPLDLKRWFDILRCMS